MRLQYGPKHSAATVEGSVPTWLFGFLVLPQAVYLGFMTTVMPYLLTGMGIPVDRIARITSLLSLPWLVSFLWAPLVDVGLRRRTWLIVSTVCAAVPMSLALLLARTGNLTLLLPVVFSGALAGSLVPAACGGMLVTLMKAANQAKASAWLEGGKLAGSAVSAALLLWLSEHVTPVYLALVGGFLVLVPALAALWIDESPSVERVKFIDYLLEFRRELGVLLRRRATASSLLLLAAPLGAGAAIPLLPGIARAYGIGVTGVIWVNGAGGGVLLALGALSGSLVPGTWDKRMTYVGAGFMNAVAASILLEGRTTHIYFAGVVLYLFTIGLCWARFAALVAEVVGPKGRNAGLRYTLIATTGNFPLVYMVFLDGAGYKRFGIEGLLWTDMAGNFVVGFVAIMALLLKGSAGVSSGD